MANEQPEQPETPSDEDFEFVRLCLNNSTRFTAEFVRVIRYVLALHDAKPAPVAVPEKVVQWAKLIAANPDRYVKAADLACVARFILSLVPEPEPEPVVEWRSNRNENGNTVWELHGLNLKTASVLHTLRDDTPAWWMLAMPDADTDAEVAEWFSGTNEGLAAAKARAEELCGVATKKGG